MVENAVHSQRIASRFEIRHLGRDLLGRGSMGDVYRATDTHTGELVAVKVLDPQQVVAGDPGILKRFVREGQALRQLNHRNIVRMIAAVEEDSRHCLVMEYVAGGSIQDLLEATRPDGSLPVSRVPEIALELADALTHAHHLGIIHRDLKPANVLLAEDGTPRLTDFGIAHVSASPRLTETGVLVGTPDFLSPEACSGHALDERTDIWAFGVLLFQMLDGGDGVGLVTDVLQTAREVKVQSTSRARLHVRGECLFHLAGMAFPDWETPGAGVDLGGRAEYSAVKLFLESARRVKPGYEPTADDLKHVARICRLVGGMPLGILLAAAWLTMLTPAEVAAEIEASLDFLETDVRDVPERQRSMRAVFDHSWNLLTERQRAVMQSLSVFRGTFTRHATADVAGASLHGLRALVDRIGRYYNGTPLDGLGSTSCCGRMRPTNCVGPKSEWKRILSVTLMRPTMRPSSHHARRCCAGSTESRCWRRSGPKWTTSGRPGIGQSPRAGSTRSSSPWRRWPGSAGYGAGMEKERHCSPGLCRGSPGRRRSAPNPCEGNSSCSKGVLPIFSGRGLRRTVCRKPAWRFSVTWAPGGTQPMRSACLGAVKNCMDRGGTS